MKKLLFLLLFIPLVSFGQIDGYKSFYVDEKSNLVKNEISKHLTKLGLKELNLKQTKNLTNKCDALLISYEYDYENIWGKANVYINFYNCFEELIFKTHSKDKGGWGEVASIKSAAKRSIGKIKKYRYDIEKKVGSKGEFYSFLKYHNELNFDSEEGIRSYLDKRNDNLEGIWLSTAENYRLLVLKDEYNYVAIILEPNLGFKKGQIKATFETSATEQIYSVKWNLPGTLEKISGFANLEKGLINISLANERKLAFLKIFPKTSSSNIAKSSIDSKWKGNGSGVIISKSGYIITNHHVIEDANDIEVEFVLNDEVQKFNAEIVQIDKTNDLAIVKIVDVNFDGVDELPYNFKTRSSDVGTKVYAFGYPMALSIMGKEIKVTDGMISSKTGFDGNITTYQITAPIQGGNSGGPLFDEKGNLIGINSSGIRKDIASNVAYSIKTSYVLNLIDILPKSIELPSNTKLESLPLTEQIKEISKYVVLIKVK